MPWMVLGPLGSANGIHSDFGRIHSLLVIKVVPVAMSGRATNDTERRSSYDLEAPQRLQHRLDCQCRL